MFRLFAPFPSITDKLPVMPNDPVIRAEPVYGKVGVLGANEADVAVVANDALVAKLDVVFKIPPMPPATVYVNGVPVCIAIGAGLFNDVDVFDSTIVNANDLVSAPVNICIADLDAVVAKLAVLAKLELTALKT